MRVGSPHHILDNHTQIWLLGNMGCISDILHQMVVTCTPQQQEQLVQVTTLTTLTILTIHYLHLLTAILHTTRCILHDIQGTCLHIPHTLWGPVFAPLVLVITRLSLDQAAAGALCFTLLLSDRQTHPLVQTLVIQPLRLVPILD